MNREMEEKVKSKYIRRVKKLLRSQLNWRNVIAGMNAWAVVIVRYGGWSVRLDKGGGIEKY